MELTLQKILTRYIEEVDHGDKDVAMEGRLFIAYSRGDNFPKFSCLPKLYKRIMEDINKAKECLETATDGVAADKVILLPIYSVAGREKEEIKKKVNSEILSRAIKRPKDVLYLDSFNKAVEYLKKNLKEGDICIIMGAGDIYLLTQKLL